MNKLKTILLSNEKKETIKSPIGGLDAVLGLLIYLASSLVASIFFGIAYSLLVGELDIDDVSPLATMSFLILWQAIGFGLLYIFFKSRNYKLKDAGINKLTKNHILTGVAAWFPYFITLLLIFFLVDNLSTSIDLNQEQDVGFNNVASSIEYILAFVALVIIAPFSEEVIFRGIVFRGLSRVSHAVVAAVVSSAIFAIAHGQINVGIDTFILGLTACYITYKTNSLWPAITLHMVKNLIAYIAIYVAV